MKTATHREWYRSLGQEIFPLAFRNAPPWVFERMRRPARPKAYCGWIIGTVAPGLSIPVRGSDGETLPEVFSPDAWKAIFARARSTLIPLRFRHTGRVIARGSDDLRLRLHPRLGLVFEARLSDHPLHRTIIGLATKAGLGVSVAFNRTRSHHETREGLGRVRVIDGCDVDHLAIIPAFGGSRSAYPAARCYGASEATLVAPWELRAKAYAHAERSMGKHSSRDQED